MSIWKFIYVVESVLPPVGSENFCQELLAEKLAKLGLVSLYPRRALTYQWLMSTAVHYRVTAVGPLFASGLEDSGHYLV